MSVIQKIQEKYAKLMAIIIAFALMIFVVMLAFENGGSLFSGGNSTTVGNVNGKTIDYNDFLKKVDQQEKSMQTQGYPSGAAVLQQAVEDVWNQEVNEVLQKNELDKLGMKIGKKEMGDILYGPNAPADLKKNFTNPQTGIYDGRQAKVEVDKALKKTKGTAEDMANREQLINYINYLENSRLTEKYNSLLSNSVNYPKWYIEKQNADNSQLAKISFVSDNYAANADSTIKISDKEIEEYIDKHKKDYKQAESRSIAFVTFSALPSAADTAAVKKQVESLKPEFDSTTNVQVFLNRNGSTVNFSEMYAGKSLMKMEYKDSIQALAVNRVFGPYLDGNTFTLAKMLDIKVLPDSVKARHILVQTTDPKTGQLLLEESIGRKRIDSIALAIRNGANFDTLAKNLSDDKGSAEKGGLLQVQFIKDGPLSEYFVQGQMVQAFNDSSFFGKKGEKKIVKTEFGYHLIEILDQKNFQPHYKAAYMAKAIETSQETEDSASNEAASFAVNSRDQKSFDANVEKLKAKGVFKNIATDITPVTYQVQGLGLSRAFVKNIYKAKLGEVLEQEKVGDNYVVAIVTEVNEEGTLPVSKARLQIEPILRNKKIAVKLKQKIGPITTLEAAAATLGGKPVETVDSLRMTGAQTSQSANRVANESKVIGAAFNPSNRGKLVPEVIEGYSGVYVVRVDNVMATPLGDANVAEQRKTRYQQAKGQAIYNSPLRALREAATIKDQRSKWF